MDEPGRVVVDSEAGCIELRKGSVVELREDEMRIWDLFKRKKKTRQPQRMLFCDVCKRGYGGITAYFCPFCGCKLIEREQQANGDWRMI